EAVHVDSQLGSLQGRRAPLWTCLSAPQEPLQSSGLIAVLMIRENRGILLGSGGSAHFKETYSRSHSTFGFGREELSCFHMFGVHLFPKPFNLGPHVRLDTVELHKDLPFHDAVADGERLFHGAEVFDNTRHLRDHLDSADIPSGQALFWPVAR